MVDVCNVCISVVPARKHVGKFQIAWLVVPAESGVAVWEIIWLFFSTERAFLIL